MNKFKIIFIFLIILMIGIGGFTFAYFNNVNTISNLFQTKSYENTVIEEFVSPDNWIPGSTTEKSLTVTNTSSIDQAVRVSFTESWTSKNSDVEGDLSLTQNGNDAVIINWTNVKDWMTVTENGVTYKYYKYKLEPNDVTSSLLESVTFNPLIINDNDCSETIVNGVRNITCTSSGEGYDGATYKLVFKVETVQYDKYKDAWNTSTNVLAEKPVSATDFLAKSVTNSANSEYNDDTKSKMFTFTHTVNSKVVTESRYIGNEPNNYVYFNCSDDSVLSTCEKWRIVGVFDVERTDPDNTSSTITEKRMKIVRGGNLQTNAMFDSSSNDWSKAGLKTTLNNTYYNSLSSTAQSQIEDAIFYLGSFYNSGSAENLYIWERGTSRTNASYALTWEGKIGLLYPSDVYMTYANGVDNVCYQTVNDCSSHYKANPSTSWIYNTFINDGASSNQWTWLISSHLYSNYNYEFGVSVGGGLDGIVPYANCGVRPTMYLKSTIKIDSGTGKIDDPYVLSGN